MASSDRNTLYRYESMRTKWSRTFKESNPRADRIKEFFKYFHRNHKNFKFVIGKLFDGTTQLLLTPSQYKQIKDEIEREIHETLPEVSQIRDTTILNEGKSFSDFKSFKDYCKTLGGKNAEIHERRKTEVHDSKINLEDTLGDKPKALVLAFDLEVYEHDHSIILEIGFIKTYLDKPEDKQTFHYIIEEYLRYKNKDCVPDNRNRFMFGKSELLSLQAATAKMQQHIDDADFLVTHSGAHDAEFLESCGVTVSEKPMFDTQILAMALLPDGPLFYSLKRLLSDLDIEYDEDILHNGGNDAYYTLEVFLALKDKL